MPLWIILDEYHHDILESSHYFDPAGRVGQFSEAFHKLALDEFTNAVRNGRITRVTRYD